MQPATTKSTESAKPEGWHSLQTEVATLRSELAELRDQVQRLTETVSTLAGKPAPTE
jgi:hypothetical protein